MRLIKLQAENIFSLLKVSVDLANLGPVLITGHSIDENTANGAGKSSLANKVISWGLFGQTVGGLKGDSVINRHIGSQASVTIDFIGNDNRPYQLKRTRNPNSLTLLQNGVDISRRLEKDTQQLVEQALGRTFETFIQIDFFGQGKFSDYLTLPPKDQKKVLEEILKLDQLSIWAEKARQLKLEIGKERSNLELELASIEGKREAIDEELVYLDYKFREWNTSNAKQAEQLNKRLIEESNKIKVDLETEVYLSEAIEEFDQKKQIIVAQLADYGLSIAHHEHTKFILLNKDIPRYKAECMKYEEMINKLEGTLNSSTCPTCFNVINEDLRINAIAEATINRKQAESTVSFSQTLLDKLDIDINRNRHLIQSLKLDISNAESKKEQLKLVKTRTSLIGEIKSQIDQLNKTVNPYTEQIEKLVASIAEIDSKIKTIQAGIAILNTRERHFTVWAAIFGKDFYAYVLNKVCPFLEQRTAKHLEGLHNPQLKVKFNSTKELRSGDTKDEFNITVSSDTGGSSFDSLSGGEQQLVSFAMGLALADLTETQIEGKSNLLILDEPFVELDAKNQESVVDYINVELAKRKETILIISNDEHLKSLIPKRIHMIKEFGISRAELYV